MRHHTYRVAWSKEDGAYVATCDEFPSLSWVDPSSIEALRGLEMVMGDLDRDGIAYDALGLGQ